MGECHQRHPAPVTSPTTMKPPRSAATPNRRPKRQSKARWHVSRHPTTPKEIAQTSRPCEEKASAWVTSVTQSSPGTGHLPDDYEAASVNGHPKSTPKETIQNTIPTARPPPPNNAQRKPHPQEKDLSVGDNRHSTVSRHPSPPLRLSSRFATSRTRLKRTRLDRARFRHSPQYGQQADKSHRSPPPGEANIVNHRHTLEVAVTNDSSLVPRPSSLAPIDKISNCSLKSSRPIYAQLDLKMMMMMKTGSLSRSYEARLNE